MFSGGFFAFIYAMRRGVYYTRSAIVKDVPKTLFLRSNSLFRLSKKPLDKVLHKLSTTNYIELDEASVDLANQKLIYILNVGGKSTAAGLAQMLSIQSASAGRSVALCNIVSDEREIKDTDQTIEISDLTFAKSKSGVDLLKLNDPQVSSSFFMGANFEKNKTNNTNLRPGVFLYKSQIFFLGLYALKPFNPSWFDAFKEN